MYDIGLGTSLQLVQPRPALFLLVTVRTAGTHIWPWLPSWACPVCLPMGLVLPARAPLPSPSPWLPAPHPIQSSQPLLYRQSAQAVSAMSCCCETWSMEQCVPLKHPCGDSDLAWNPHALAMPRAVLSRLPQWRSVQGVGMAMLWGEASMQAQGPLLPPLGFGCWTQGPCPVGGCRDRLDSEGRDARADPSPRLLLSSEADAAGLGTSYSLAASPPCPSPGMTLLTKALSPHQRWISHPDWSLSCHH